ncbi:alkaline phosphatase [Micrococcus sp.]|uniref:alkaline phosphatase D family protein n=1 Tax=Micrococcus sp. TaxID=1271 RepID=UPI0026DB1D24|nr:alkaline phosphatase D family protein [Micrococcus sp.]MDO4238802.1 alkaline phosphatase D family protein [Micrococcus sp.]
MSSHPPSPTHTSRRTVLTTGSLVVASAALLGTPARAAGVPDPFTLGVASGDPWPDGFVVWTRLAVSPLDLDGLGGMGQRATDVEYQVAEDERFTRVVRSGVVTTGPEQGHAVHVTLTGLKPGREYFYRFRALGHVSRVGRAVTAPAFGAHADRLRMTVASCANWEHGYFTAYGHMAAERPDLMVHLGDYYYELMPYGYPVSSGVPRAHKNGESRTLAQYRARMAQYKTDPHLQDAHAAAPWLVIWDDHEVENNWADETPEIWDRDFLARRAAAFRAYYENMPLRVSSMPRGIDMQLYRRIQWGDLATFHLLDTRQYRSDQANLDLIKVVDADARDPRRSITGAAQEAWLQEGFQTSTARWDLVTQQVPFVQYDRTAGPLLWGDMDTWDGYVASRERVVDAWVQAGVRNPVVLTGDIHEAFASDIKRDFNDLSSAPVGVELITTSITSGGDGSDSSTPALAWNPHIKFNNDLRGYLSVDLTPELLEARFQVLDYVSELGSSVRTRAVFGVGDGEHRLHRIA